jgi:hypothetical protein
MATVVIMEIDEPGDVADRILGRLDAAFFVGKPHHLGQFEVMADIGDIEAMRERIAAVATEANPDWEDYMHFVRDQAA